MWAVLYATFTGAAASGLRYFTGKIKKQKYDVLLENY